MVLPAFILLATANSAGYRYGASDLAFYGPAVMRHLDPQLFPRDRGLIDAQARLTLMDETVGTIAQLTTTNFPVLFLALYLVTLALLAVSATLIGSTLYRSPWSTAALLAALTLRHAIPRSGANTLEAYFHPRQLAFAFGALAIAAFLRGRLVWVVAALAGAALLHPTTTLWFVIWLSVATFIVADQRSRVVVGTVAAVGATASLWALTAGPLAGRLLIMDADWLAALAEKEYLFPLRWPPSAWIVNLGYVPIIWLIYRRRAARGLLTKRETALVAGCLSLIVVFPIALMLNASRVALAIQLQPARLFWMLDFLAVIYGVWAVTNGHGRPAWWPAFATSLLFAISSTRGLYIMRVEFPDRQLFEFAVAGDWGRVMSWARTTPPDTAFLAHPNHASLYGTSIRMAAQRDVFVEGVKDAAIGMYDRAMAIRTRDRLRVLDDFAALSPERARQLASEYDLTYLVTEKDMPMPLAFQSGPVRVYRMR